MQILHCNLMFSSFYVLNENHTWTVKLILRSNLLVANINMAPTVNQSFAGPWDMQGWRGLWKRQAMKWKPQRQYGKEWQLTPPHPTPLLSSHLSQCSPSWKDQTQLTKVPDAIKGHQTFKTIKFIFISCKAS